MSELLECIIFIVALILMGVFATFLLFANYISSEEKRIERLEYLNNDEIKK